MSFQKKLEKIIKINKSLVCIGLDSDYDRLPASIKKRDILNLYSIKPSLMQRPNMFARISQTVLFMKQEERRA